MPFATNNNTKIYYEVRGQGEPLVMLMGLGGNGTAWVMQYQALENDYQCVLIDNRGAGRSDMPDEPYSIELFADDVAAVLGDAGIEAAHIMGASMGGLIAQAFYHQHPKRVRSLILACTGVGAGDPEFIWPEPRVLEVLSEPQPEDNNLDYLKRYASIFYDAQFVENTPNLFERLVEKRNAMPQPDYANKRQLEACITHTPNSPRLANIHAPTLVIHGENDLVWPLKNAHYLAENIPNAQLAVLPNAAHMLFVEQAVAFNDSVRTFLANQR